MRARGAGTRLATLARGVNFARLNHVLIPDTKEGRDRLRSGWVGRISGPLARGYGALSDEGRVLFAIASIAAFFGLDVGDSQNHLIWAGLLSLVVGSVAVRPLFHLAGVQVEIEAPRRPTVGERVSFHLTIRNEGDRDVSSLRCERPFLPWDGEWLGPKPSVDVLPLGGARRVRADARFIARGRHHIDPFGVGALVPLGLALGDRVESSGTRFTVVPRIARVALRDPSRAVRHQPGGVALASNTGESSELVGLRPYRSGDRLRDLHARTWARVGVPVVREYHQEYFSRTAVLLDVDRTVAGEPEIEASISLAAGLVAALERGEGLVDLLATDGGSRPLTLGRSVGTLDQALEQLACVEPEDGFDAANRFERLRPHLDRLSCVYFVAQRWDDARHALASAIRRGGVACRVVVVAGADSPVQGLGDPDAVSFSVPRIVRACEGGEPLAL